MATGFQLTAIIFIFSYSPAIVQNKTKQGVIKTVQVNEPYKAEKNVIPLTKNAEVHAVNASKNTMANHNFSWKRTQPEMNFGTGTGRAVTKTENGMPALASFTNFTEIVISR